MMALYQSLRVEKGTLQSRGWIRMELLATEKVFRNLALRQLGNAFPLLPMPIENTHKALGARGV
jgi:hypothetical protein